MYDPYSESVRQFLKAFGYEPLERPKALDVAFRINRAHDIMEHLTRFVHNESLVGQMNHMADILYYIMGAMIQNGVDPLPIFEAVHDANMSKLWPDGRPRFRKTDFRIMKPEDWVAPEIEIGQLLQELNNDPPQPTMATESSQSNTKNPKHSGQSD